MRLYAIKFPDNGTYYVSHEENKDDKFLKNINVDKDLNCVVGIGREKNARALAGYLTAFSGHRTEVVAIERDSSVIGSIATFQPEEVEVPDAEPEVKDGEGTTSES